MSILFGTFGEGLNNRIFRYSSEGTFVSKYEFGSTPSKASPKLMIGPNDAVYGFTQNYSSAGGDRSDLFAVDAAGNYSIVAGFVGPPTNSNSGLVGSEGNLFYSTDDEGPFKIDSLGTRTLIATWDPTLPQFFRSLQRISANRLLGISDEDRESTIGATTNGTITMFQNTFVPPPVPPVPPVPNPNPNPGPTPLPAPTAPVADTAPPELTIRGRKTVKTLRKRVVIRGMVSDDSGVDKIDVKARGAKAKQVKLLAGDRFKIVLNVTKDSGRVVVKLRATDKAGLRSRPAKLRILRR